METQVKGEPLRQQAAIIQKLTPLKGQLDGILSIVKRQVENYDERCFGRTDLVWTVGSLSTLSGYMKN